MTFLLPTPRTAAFNAYLEVADVVRRLVLALLTRTRRCSRHRLLSPGQTRWRSWKSAFAANIVTDLVGRGKYVVRHPRPPARPHRETSRAPASRAPTTPTRMAQSQGLAPPELPEVRPGERTGLRLREPAGVWPEVRLEARTGAWPGERAGVRLEERTVVWPEVRSEPWAEARAEPWSESRAEPWSEPWSGACAASWSEPKSEPWPEQRPEPWSESWPAPSVEPWAGRADTFFAGHIDEPAHVDPFAGRHAVGRSEPAPAVGWPGVAESPDAWPGFTERVFAHAAHAERVAEPATDAETTVVEPLWEFQLGDLARWWEEAKARLESSERATRTATGLGHRVPVRPPPDPAGTSS